jgi:hypothetical protein
MPTARELLEQADALMRRNRGSADSIPVLTETVAEALREPDLRGPSTRERASATLRGSPETAAVAANAADEDLALALERSLAESAATEPPVLTDAVEEVAVDLVPLPGKPEDEEGAPWLGPDTVDPALHSITGPWPDSVAVVPALRAEPRSDEPVAEETFEAPVARTLRAAGSEPTPAPLGSMPEETPVGVAVDEERWRALAEQISMQVLQRLDLFVDAGLKAKLASHLEPIVERAGNELVEAINEHVGQLVRSYVSEAIEREIAQFRQGQA